TGTLDDDGFLRRAALPEVIGPIEQQAQLAGITVAVVLVEAGMHQDHVTGLHARRIGIEPVRAIGAFVVGGEQTGESGLLALPFVTRRVDMEHPAALRYLWLRAGA